MSVSIVFDLDDTLYLERDYVRSGFLALDRWVETELGVRGFGAAALAAWNGGERRRCFDVALATLGIRATEKLIKVMIDRYRHHPPDIVLAPDADCFLRTNGHGRRMALITDGPAVAQRLKINALRLGILGLDPIIATDEWGSAYWKPHARAFREVEACHGPVGRHFLYVADNPAKDFIAPRALGWGTIQIDRQGAVHARMPAEADHAAHAVIESLVELTPLLIEAVLAEAKAGAPAA